MEHGQRMKLEKALIKKASESCAKAFEDDVYSLHLIPDKSKRSNLHFAFEYYLGICMCAGAEIWTTSSVCEGVAVLQDSQKKDPFALFLRGGNPLLPLRCGWRYVLGEIRAEKLANKIRKQFAPSRHVYLALLAVDPVYQGKGFAGKLLRPVLDELDRRHSPCYLETQTTKNVSLYEHYGFEVVHQTFFDGIVPFWAMLRK